jgi:hypothetical protein
MWLQAFFSSEDLLRAVSHVTPARVPLDRQDPARFLWVSKPERLRLSHGAVVLDARAQLHWDVLGLRVPVTLKTVSLSLSPTVEDAAGHEVLAFHLQVEAADLSGVPAFVEKSLIERVNEALRSADAKLSWKFLETLDFRFKLPVIAPVREIALYARRGSAEVTEEGLTLTVGWGLDAQVLPGQDESAPDVITEGSEREVPQRDEPVGGPRPLVPRA